MQFFFDQDPFDPDEFVERLAWRTIGSSSRNDADQFDPIQLQVAFERTIQELKDMDQRVQGQVQKLENQCKDEEKAHWDRVADLQKKNQVLVQLKSITLHNTISIFSEGGVLRDSPLGLKILICVSLIVLCLLVQNRHTAPLPVKFWLFQNYI